MFGFSTVGFLMAFYFIASALATLLVVAACIASGNASQETDKLFARRAIEKRSLVAATATTFGSDSLPNANHRFLATEGVDTVEAVEGKSKNESVRSRGEQAVKKEAVRA